MPHVTSVSASISRTAESSTRRYRFVYPHQTIYYGSTISCTPYQLVEYCLTVVCFVRNLDPATLHTNEVGLHRFAGDRNVPEKNVAYCKRSQNATEMLASWLSRFITTTTLATPARLTRIERIPTATSSMPNRFQTTTRCFQYVEALSTSERSLSRSRIWEHSTLLEVLDKLRSGYFSVDGMELYSLQVNQPSLRTISAQQADLKGSNLTTIGHRTVNSELHTYGSQRGLRTVGSQLSPLPEPRHSETHNPPAKPYRAQS
ncbi:hypothetical protein IG631_23575 [Alternaria alternata]|nr:hypothetical protein IG631_23575 [Alternaria alternata]